MPPTLLLAQLYAERSLPGFAHSALPDAPVQPTTSRPRLAWRWPVVRRGGFGVTGRPAVEVGRAAAC